LPLVFQDRITAQDLRDHPDRLYLFGDNEARQGRGGLPNAVGVPTKRSPRTSSDASSVESQYERQVAILERDLTPAFVRIRRGGTLICPSAGPGTGLSGLPLRAPCTFEPLPRLIVGLKLLGEAEGLESGPHVRNKKNGAVPPDATYCGRPSAFRNPFVIGEDGSRADVIRKHDAWIQTQPRLLSLARELSGKHLVCWCAPLPCHCDILRRLANPKFYPPARDGPQNHNTINSRFPHVTLNRVSTHA
jgi:hypothetical protein